MKVTKKEIRITKDENIVEEYFCNLCGTKIAGFIRLPHSINVYELLDTPEVRLFGHGDYTSEHVCCNCLQNRLQIAIDNIYKELNIKKNKYE